MSKQDLNALLGIPLILSIGLGFAFAGSDGRFPADVSNPLGLCVLFIFALQWVAFVPAYLKRTETFFDLVGSATFLSAILLGLVLTETADSRALLLAAMVAIWAFRLGVFLVNRIHRAGKDERFDKLKHSFIRFLAAWTLQGLWVTFTAAAALVGITSSNSVPLGWFAGIGGAVWLAGFGLEAMADWQKSRFRADPANKGAFIKTGLWARSRHPNYFGEIVLWVGVALVAVPVLQGWQWLVLSSPVFVTILLLRVSGIPLLEKRADEKWGGDADYEAYKRDTPVLVPRLW